MRRLTPSSLKRFVFAVCSLTMLLVLTGCEEKKAIISGVDEKEANIIVVMLQSKGISATKAKAPTSGAGGDATPMYNISVKDSQMVDAIAFLNQNGLPKKKGTTLLDLFGKQGLMTTEKEETIRYQAGLAQQISNTIMMIDGVIDSSVQLSFPPEETIPGQQQTEKKITAAVYVKHQGIIDDPNAHLEDKIKRLVSGSITGLDMNDVTVVSDRSRFTDITMQQLQESAALEGNEYVSIWSIVMSKSSAARFRVLFFLLSLFLLLFAVVAGWLIWKLYPLLRNGRSGLKTLISPKPLSFPAEQEPAQEE